MVSPGAPLSDEDDSLSESSRMRGPGEIVSQKKDPHRTMNGEK